MADKKTYTGLSKNYATVPAFSITTIDYLDTKPNYFRVQNRGTTEIYCSTNNMPTTKHYDFAVAGKKMKMFAEPYNRTRLYIFNPSGSDVEVAVLSFQAEFEPLTLALSEIEVEMPKEFETSMAITSFNAPLPTGNNKIGKVEVPNGVAITSFNAPLPSGNNKIGKVEVTNAPSAADITSIKTNTTNILSKLGYLMSNTPSTPEAIKLYDIMTAVWALAAANTFFDNISTFEENEKSTDTVLCTNKSCVIHMLTNDGAGNLILKIKGKEDTQVSSLTLKTGESIADLKIDAASITVSGTNYSFRAMISTM